MLGLNRAVLAEGLVVARCSGIDPSLALEILQASPAYSKSIANKASHLLEVAEGAGFGAADNAAIIKAFDD